MFRGVITLFICENYTQISRWIILPVWYHSCQRGTLSRWVNSESAAPPADEA